MKVGVVGVGRLVTDVLAECVSIREAARRGCGVGAFSTMVSIFDLGLSMGEGLGMRVVPEVGLLVKVMVVPLRREGLELFAAVYLTLRLSVSFELSKILPSSISISSKKSSLGGACISGRFAGD